MIFTDLEGNITFIDFIEDEIDNDFWENDLKESDFDE